MTSSREPRYGKNCSHRIVSRPNGLWQLQSRSSAEGSRTIDPWQDEKPPSSFEEAKASLAELEQASKS